MAQRSIIVRLQAEVAGYIAGMGAAAKSTDTLAQKQKQASDSISKNADSMDRVGKSMATFGVGAVAALGLATKAAMDWETAWAGVTKTVDGSPAQMAELEEGLRNLAKTLPATHEEIAGVAEAAGQLGVKREDILGFTKTMIGLGETTNLTADEAATSIAQISNVMGTMDREGSVGVERFAATLVALGNAGASTEKEILEMAKRLAGAGSLIGASEGEVLALANAMASVGIEAQLGGGVMSRVMQRMYADVQNGGKGLEELASVAGVSAAEFSEAFKNDPVAAVDMMVQGLNTVKESGGNVMQTLSDLGIKGTEETSVILRLAGAGTLLADGLKLQDEAWKANTAAVDEAAKRYATTESQVQVAMNGIKDAAIDTGAVMLPVVQKLAEGAASIANAWSDVPAPIQGFVAVAALAVGGAGLLGGAALTLIPKIVATRAALVALQAAGSGIPGTFKGLAKGLGIAGIALAAATGITALHNSMQPATTSAEEYASALEGLEKNADSIDDVFADIQFGDGDRLQGEIDGVGDALSRLTSNDVGDWAARLGAGMGVDNGFARLKQGIDDTDAALKGALDSGNMEQATNGFRAIAESAEEQGVSLDTVMEKFPQYASALKAKAAAAGEDLDATELLNYAMGELPPAMQAAADAAAKEAAAVELSGVAAEQSIEMTEELAKALAEIGVSAEGTVTDLSAFTDALVAAGLLSLSTKDAARNYQASIDALSDSLATNGTTLDIHTQAGRDNEAALDGIAAAGLNYATALAEETDQLGRNVNSQEDVQAALQSTYDEYLANAEAMGVGTEAATALAREALGIPDEVSIETFMSETAKMMADATTGSVDLIPKQVQVESWMSEAAMLTANDTKRSADDVPDDVTIQSWMSDAAFQEALVTRAAAEGIPPDVAIASFMESAARNEADSTTAQILGIPRGASVSSFMEAYARIEAQNLKGSLDAVDGRRINTYADFWETTHKQVIVTEKNERVGVGQVGRNAMGGRIPKRADGGRLPTSGPGTDVTDGILGVSSIDGTPTSWVDAGEWVVNRRMSDKYDRELRAINAGTFPKLQGFAAGGRVSGLAANPGEANSSWQARQERIVQGMADVVGGIQDWQIHEDGSGWIQTMDNAMIRISDGAWTVTTAATDTSRRLFQSAEDARLTGETAKAAGGSFQGAGSSASAAGGLFQGAGFSANSTAGTFQIAGQVTQQAAQAIVAATAAVNAAGVERAAAKGGGITARSGEANAVWRGRQDEFEQALSKQFGGVKYSDIHEDGSGQIVLDDGRLIELDNGRWKFVSAFKYGAPLINGKPQRRVSKYSTGGQVVGPGTGTSDEAGLYELSNGEHVLTAADVVAMGGQSAVYDWRKQLHASEIREVRGSLARGGGISTSSTDHPVPAYLQRGGGSGGNVEVNHITRIESVTVKDVDQLGQVLEANRSRAATMSRLRQSKVRSR